MHKKILRLAISFGVGISVLFTLKSNAVNDYRVTQNIRQGEIDWTNKTIKVTGMGAIPEDKPAAQARLLAERAAISDAYRNMAEVVNGVRVDSETIVKDFVTESDTIKLKVDAFIKGARRGEKRVTSDGAVEYDLYLPLYGKNGLADTIGLDQHINKARKAPVSFKYRAGQAVKNYDVNTSKLNFFRNYHRQLVMSPSQIINPNFFIVSQNPEDTDMKNCLQCHKVHDVPKKKHLNNNFKPNKITSDNNNKITGLIIDARGLGLVPAMDPAILSDQQQRLYIGNWEIDPDYVINNGILGYYSDLEAAKMNNERIGNNPLIIKAESVKGFTDLILNPDASSELNEANSSSKFLENYAVNVVM